MRTSAFGLAAGKKPCVKMRFPRYYGLLRPCRCASVLSPSRLTPLVASPVMPAFEVAGMDAVQVLTFRPKAWSRFAPPTRRMPPVRIRTSPELVPQEGSPRGFDIA
jgi:hypothetical protein